MQFSFSAGKSASFRDRSFIEIPSALTTINLKAMHKESQLQINCVHNSGCIVSTSVLPGRVVSCCCHRLPCAGDTQLGRYFSSGWCRVARRAAGFCSRIGQCV